MKELLDLLQYFKTKKISLDEIVFENETQSSILLSFVYNENYYYISIYSEEVSIYYNKQEVTIKLEEVINYLEQIL